MPKRKPCLTSEGRPHSYGLVLTAMRCRALGPEERVERRRTRRRRPPRGRRRRWREGSEAARLTGYITGPMDVRDKVLLSAERREMTASARGLGRRSLVLLRPGAAAWGAWSWSAGRAQRAASGRSCARRQGAVLAPGRCRRAAAPARPRRARPTSTSSTACCRSRSCSSPSSCGSAPPNRCSTSARLEDAQAVGELDEAEQRAVVMAIVRREVGGDGRSPPGSARCAGAGLGDGRLRRRGQSPQSQSDQQRSRAVGTEVLSPWCQSASVW